MARLPRYVLPGQPQHVSQRGNNRSPTFFAEGGNYRFYRRALRRADQLALEDLFISARKHVAEMQYASNALPFETILLAMLLEEHKEVMRLRGQVEHLLEWAPKEQPRLEIPPAKLEEEWMASQPDDDDDPDDAPGEVLYVPVDE
jgi:hypothetical protein